MQYERYDSLGQKRADAMVGQQYDKITVIDSLGMNVDTGHYVVVGQCECGDVRNYNASSLRRVRNHMCPRCGGYGHHVLRKQTLCWKCASATNRFECSWADGRPREDWVAEHAPIKYEDRTVDSYIVIECPGFREDRR